MEFSFRLPAWLHLPVELIYQLFIRFYAHPTTSPDTMPTVPEITVQELKAMLDAGNKPFILDVRGTNEYQVANLDGHLIELSQLPLQVDQIADKKEQLVIVHCRSGARSAQAVNYLQAEGFKDARNLKGGILAWSREIDPSIPQY